MIVATDLIPEPSAEGCQRAQWSGAHPEYQAFDLGTEESHLSAIP